MNRLFDIRFLAFLLFASLAACQQETETTQNYNDRMWYDEPAQIWQETLPLGNGRLGLSPDGGVMHEHIVLNDISMWAGSEADYGNPEASKSLGKIRQLLFEGKNEKAQELMYKSFVPKSTQGASYGSYQMLADFDIEMDSRHAVTDSISAYRRTLDMSEGIHTTEFAMADGSNIVRECFASRANDVIIIRYTSDKTPLSLTAQISRPQDGTVSSENNMLTLKGELPSGQENVSGVKYAALVSCQVEGEGSKASVSNEGWSVKNAKTITFTISAATTLLFGKEYLEEAASLLAKAQDKNYNTKRKEHAAAHSALYNRVRLNIEGNGDSLLTTDARINNFGNSQDPAMAALYYNFGRYSLISSTREGSLPPNLQGLWANECGTPWNGDYHTNINVQMNHWPLEPGNLDELYEPLIKLVENSVRSGEESARTFYGSSARGWVMHMMTNVWRFTAPGEHPSWGATNTGGAWLCEHLYERYQYTLDTAYLARIYPIMRGAAEFFCSTMVNEPKHGWLVTAPTSSPENEFYMPGSNTPTSICMGPTMDTQIITELFTNVAEAAQILGRDADFAQELKDKINQLPPMQISDKGGYLQEWLEDYREVDLQHRHVSHLYGLHPSNQISPLRTPELAEACKKTLNRRGDGGTGWSRAWKINFWARLHDGDRAMKLFASLLQPAVDTLTLAHGSGTFPNLWCSHPPFQLDGNFGGAAGIGEMILQSHNGYIDPLPALPQTWLRGRVKGMKVRGGAEVQMSWAEGKLKELTLSGGKAESYNIAIPSNVSFSSIAITGEKDSSFETYTECGQTFIRVTNHGQNARILFE